jgi:phospholipid/cholesterol/gamma-HCH transport system substrate-binding protein
VSRRPPIVLAVLAVLAALVAIAVRGGSDRPGDVRFDAIFDTAKGMVPGQLLKVGGVRAGTVTAVHVTPDRKARMSFRMEARYGPLRRDARCRILPEGFISESFVDCAPGRTGAPLTGRDGRPPTVPVSRTQVPVALQDVVDLFAVPTADRIGALLTTLGVATAGRGEDLDALLRRANPALADANGALAIVDRQRRRLGAATTQLSTVMARLAQDDAAVRRFVDRGAAAATVTAARRAELGTAVRRLPATLRATDDGLTALDRTARRLRPLVRDLRTSAPALRRITTTLPAFAHAGTPALRELRAAARRGGPALVAIQPVFDDLRGAAARLAPTIDRARRLLIDTRDRGGIEETLRLLYSLATVTALRDDVSHIVSIFAGVYPQCIVSRSTPGCSHAYAAPGQGTVPVNVPSRGAQEATGRVGARTRIPSPDATPAPDADRTATTLRRRMRELGR